MNEILLDPPATDQLAFADRAAFLLRRCSHADRLRILIALREREHAVHELQDRLRMRQPALSQQLADLRRTGIVAARKASKHVFYRLVDERARRLIDLLADICGEPQAAGPAVPPPARGRTEPVRPRP